LYVWLRRPNFAIAMRHVFVFIVVFFGVERLNAHFTHSTLPGRHVLSNPDSSGL
jgi:hypothetical protein